MDKKNSEKTVAELRGDNVRHAADKLKDIRFKLKKWKTSEDDTSVDQLLVSKKNERGETVLEINKDALKKWTKQNAKKILKLTGGTLLWTAEYLTRTLNKLVVDNAFLRNMEKFSRNFASEEFIRKHPWLESYSLYFALMTMFVFTGVKVAEDVLQKDDENQDDKQKIEVVVENQDEKATKKIIDANNKNFVEQTVQKYWPCIAVGLTELETYYNVSKRIGTEKRETNGLGCTYYYKYDEKAVLHCYPNEINETKRWSIDYNYDQARRHLMFSTMPAVRNAIKNKQNIKEKHVVALALAGYQIQSDLKDIADGISNAKNEQDVADAFLCYSGAEKWRDGTLKRRWWCAAYATGMISEKDFLSLPRDAFSQIALDSVYQNGHFVMTDDVVQYALKRAKTGKKSTVKDFLKNFEAGKDILTSVESENDDKTIAFNDAIKLIKQQDLSKQNFKYYNPEQDFNMA